MILEIWVIAVDLERVMWQFQITRAEGGLELEWKKSEECAAVTVVHIGKKKGTSEQIQTMEIWWRISLIF